MNHKTHNGKKYVRTPEIRFMSCLGCVAQNDKADFQLCDAIRDKHFCQHNNFMIYKEEK